MVTSQWEIKETWNKSNYQEFLKYLKSLQDTKYKEFHSSLVLNSKYEMIGVRLPMMRDIAKKIAKGNIKDFLTFAQDKYYEEVMIQGLVISQIKEEPIFYSYFQQHIHKIDNWALCDSFCNSLKIVKKYEEKYFKEAISLALYKEEFLSRVGLVLLLNFFCSKEHLKDIFETLNKIKSDLLYINMAEAWLVCELYVHFPEETMLFLKKNQLNNFTQNKAISKIHDSYRVSAEEKEMLNALRR